MKNFKNILLINFGGIGDEILFMPVLQVLKKQYPECKITLCLEGRSKAFVNLCKYVDDYFCVDIKTKNKYVEMLKLYFKALTGGYDLVISAGGSPLIAMMLYFTGIKTRIGYKTSNLAEKLLTNAVPLNKNQYASKMYFDLVRPICDFEFELPSIEVEAENNLENSVLVHPGVSAMSVSKFITKTFNGKTWAELIKQILKTGKNVYLVGGPDDTECIFVIREELKDIQVPNFHDLFGKTKNIFDLVKLIKQSEVLVCSDSAPMHIGVAVNTKTIAVFGPTDDKKLLPESNKFFAVHNNADCRPCLWEKRQTTCNDLKCLDIPVEEILKLL